MSAPFGKRNDTSEKCFNFFEKMKQNKKRKMSSK